MKMERTVCSETSAYKIQMLGNYPEENIHDTHSWKCRAQSFYGQFFFLPTLFHSFTTCCVTGPTPSPSTSFLLAQAIFEPNLLLYDTPTILRFSLSTATCLWRWNRVFRNVGISNSDAGELPRRKHTTFTTRRKFEIKNCCSVSRWLAIILDFYQNRRKCPKPLVL